MDKMGFHTDFTKAADHILEDKQSMDCLKEVGLTKDSLEGILGNLKDNHLPAVFADGTLKGLLYQLFTSADTCIADTGCVFTGRA